MRKTLLAFFLLCSIVSRAQDIDVLHYKYSLELSDRNDTIYGQAFIKLLMKNPSGTISLNLSELDKNGKGMQVDSVLVLGQHVFHSTTLEFSDFLHDGNNVLIPVSTLNPKKPIQVYIWYKGVPRDGLIISKNKYGDRTFFADNWPNRAHHWIPCNDRPDDKASFEFIITAPLHYSIISNGLKVEEKDKGNGFKITHWKEETPLPTKVMAIGVAKFATKTYDNSPKDIPVSAWVFPQDSTKGFYDYALTPDILKFFTNYIAPFPYKKLANVQSKTIFGGMENASAIFYAENSVTGDRSKEDLLAHEIAHQWFGDMASEKSFAHLWLSEGFATFLTNYYWEKKYGKEAAAKRWKENRDEVIAFTKENPRPVVDSTKDLMSLLNPNSYQKGAWVLHMLRNEVGDSIFQKIIQTYYHQYKGGNAETRDFEAVAEKVSGKELTWFFDQWLYTPSIPKFEITWDYMRNSILLTPFGFDKTYTYNFPLEILLVYKDGKTEKQVLKVKTNGNGTYVIPSKDKPLKILLDPETKLLFEGKISAHQ